MASSEELLEQTFPNLRATGYRITSPRTRDYNCLAWVAGDDTLNWDYSRSAFAYWPRRLPRDGSIATLIAVLATLSYTPCDDGNLQSDYEKIAIYSADGLRWTLAARQLETGKWSSKIGALEDIEHDSLDGISCPDYGSVVGFVRRMRKTN